MLPSCSGRSLPRLFIQYLSDYNNENFPNSIQNAQVDLKRCPIQNNHKNAKVVKFRWIW